MLGKRKNTYLPIAPIEKAMGSTPGTFLDLFLVSSKDLLGYNLLRAWLLSKNKSPSAIIYAYYVIQTP